MYLRSAHATVNRRHPTNTIVCECMNRVHRMPCYGCKGAQRTNFIVVSFTIDPSQRRSIRQLKSERRSPNNWTLLPAEDKSRQIICKLFRILALFSMRRNVYIWANIEQTYPLSIHTPTWFLMTCRSFSNETHQRIKRNKCVESDQTKRWKMERKIKPFGSLFRTHPDPDAKWTTDR